MGASKVCGAAPGKLAVLGRLPRVVGGLLVAAYGYFLWKGLLQ